MPAGSGEGALEWDVKRFAASVVVAARENRVKPARTAAAVIAGVGKGPKFTAAISRFARLYADQNERDHAQLVAAIAAGAVESQPG